MRKLLPLIFLVSCSYGPMRSQSLTFHEPSSIYKTIANTYIQPETCSILQHLTGVRKLKDMGKELMKDMGGVSVQITTEYGTLEGMYFDPELFHARETSTYKKWRKLLAQEKNVRLSQIYEVEFKAHSLPGLFSMPRFIKPIKKKHGVLCLPAAGIDYELDPQFILTFLMRGIHVLAINYSGIEWKKTCLEAKAATEWLVNHLKVANSDITICGKSFGSGPATYAAIECKGSNLIIDRGYARLSDACHTNSFMRWLIEKYYRFPNEDWISQVQGKILIIEAREDTLLQGHAERLYNALITHKTKTLISVSGGHYGLYWGDPSPSWYTDDHSQAKLDHFLE